MGTTTKGIVYPSNYGVDADVPADLETMAESIDGLLDDYQVLIDPTHKISADDVDDTNTTNKFTNASEKATWNAKQNALTFDATPTANSPNPVTSEGIKTYVDNKVSAVYKYKGSVATYADLPSTDLTTGDVYNVQSDGSNYAWTGTEWDKLGGEVDLSNYYTKSQTDELLNGKQNKLTFDIIPTASSTNPVTSGGIKTYVDTIVGDINSALDIINGEVI